MYASVYSAACQNVCDWDFAFSPFIFLGAVEVVCRAFLHWSLRVLYAN